MHNAWAWGSGELHLIDWVVFSATDSSFKDSNLYCLTAAAMILNTFTLLTGILLSLTESDIMTREVEALIWLLVGAGGRVLAGYQHLLQHNVPLVCKVGLYTFQLPCIYCKHYLGHYLNVNFIQWIENSRMYKGHSPLEEAI